MDFFGEGFLDAFRLLLAGDRDTWDPIVLSLWTSISAVAIGGAIGVPFGTWLGVAKPKGTAVFATLLRAGMGFPTVVVGLLLYGLFRREGPLGPLGWNFTPQAVVVGQSLLAFPILASLSYGAAAALDPRVMETIRTHGGKTGLAVRLAISEARPAILGAALVAFSRVLTELGVVLVVGGPIKGLTRTMPALIALETGKGEFGRAVACGLVLVALACGAGILAYRPSREAAA